jgi:hypothetical protein
LGDILSLQSINSQQFETGDGVDVHEFLSARTTNGSLIMDKPQEQLDMRSAKQSIHHG